MKKIANGRRTISVICVRWLVFVKRSRARITSTIASGLARSKFRQRHPFTAIFEDNLHRHVDVDLFDGATDDVAAESRPVVEIDPGGDVGNIRSEALERVADDFTDDGETKDFAFAADLHPFQFFAGAVAANRPRAEHPGAAVLALLHHELAGPGSVPERLVDGSDFG